MIRTLSLAKPLGQPVTSLCFRSVQTASFVSGDLHSLFFLLRLEISVFLRRWEAELHFKNVNSVKPPSASSVPLSFFPPLLRLFSYRISFSCLLRTIARSIVWFVGWFVSASYDGDFYLYGQNFEIKS